MRGVSPLDAMIDLSIEEKLDAHFLAENMGHNLDDKVGAYIPVGTYPSYRTHRMNFDDAKFSRLML